MRLLALYIAPCHLQGERLAVLARDREVRIELHGSGEIGIGPPPIALIAQRKAAIIVGERHAVIERDSAVVIGQRAVEVGFVALEIIGQTTNEIGDRHRIEMDRSIVIPNRTVVGVVTGLYLTALAIERGGI